MNLLEVRKKLVELSGLYSLVTDYTGNDFTDNGADWFIQAGQRWLDGLLETPKSPADFGLPLSVGDFSKVIGSVRAIKSVRVEDSSIGTRFLNKLTFKEMKNKYSSKLFQKVEKGIPVDYSIAVSRSSFQNGQISGQEDAKIYFLPRADRTLSLIVRGLFFSLKLTSDTETNFWTLNYPDLLIQAALYKRETFLRNTQGQNDWRNAIIDAVTQIDFDVVEEEIVGRDQINDSWNFRKSIIRRGSNDFQR